MAAIEAVQSVAGGARIHAMGLFALAAHCLRQRPLPMARDGDDRLQSVTLLATQTDFTEAGELMLFVNESQLAFLDDMMWAQGYLDAKRWRAPSSCCAQTISSGRGWFAST